MGFEEDGNIEKPSGKSPAGTKTMTLQKAISVYSGCVGEQT
jgi:hypothetical protein